MKYSRLAKLLETIFLVASFRLLHEMSWFWGTISPVGSMLRPQEFRLSFAAEVCRARSTALLPD